MTRSEVREIVREMMIEMSRAPGLLPLPQSDFIGVWRGTVHLFAGDRIYYREARDGGYQVGTLVKSGGKDPFGDEYGVILRGWDNALRFVVMSNLGDPVDKQDPLEAKAITE